MEISNAAQGKIQVRTVPESKIRENLLAYKQTIDQQNDMNPLIREAEKRAADSILANIELIDWYSLSNFWMLYNPVKKKASNNKKTPWRSIMPRESKRADQYARVALRTLSTEGNDYFLMFIAELEYHCRFHIFRDDILGNRKAKLCSARWEPVSVPDSVKSVLRKTMNPYSVCQNVDMMVEKALVGGIPKLQRANETVRLAVKAYNQLSLQSRSHNDTDGKTELNDAANSSKTERKHADPRRRLVSSSEGVNWEVFRDTMIELLARLHTAAHSFKAKLPYIYTKTVPLLTMMLQETLPNHNTKQELSSTKGNLHSLQEEEEGDDHSSKFEEPPSVMEETDVNAVGLNNGLKSCEDVPPQVNSPVVTDEGLQEEKLAPNGPHHRLTLKELCEKSIAEFEDLINELNQKRQEPFLCSMFDLFHRYGLSDSREKLRSIYQLDGAAKCVVGGDFEEKVVMEYLPNICGVIAESYSVVKGINVEEARTWLTWCLCPHVMKSDINEECVAPKPPISRYTCRPVPKLLYSTGTVMRCYFEFQPQCRWLEKPFSVGEFDLLLLEDTPSLDILFAFEVKNNCADIEKAGRQRDKLFMTLDQVKSFPTLRVGVGAAEGTSAPLKQDGGGMRGRGNNRRRQQGIKPPLPSAPSRPFLLDLQATLCSPHTIIHVDRKEKTAKNEQNETEQTPLLNGNTTTSRQRIHRTVCKLNEKNFSKHFSNPEERRAHFIMITTLPEKEYQPSLSPIFFASNGRMSTFLIRHYADEVSHRIIKDLYHCIERVSATCTREVPRRTDPLIQYLARSAFSLSQSPPTHRFLTFPLSLPTPQEMQAKNADGNSVPPPSAEVLADALQYAIYLKRHHAFSLDDLPAYRHLKLLHPLPEYTARLPSCPCDKTFTDVLSELLQYRTLRTLLFL